MPVLTCSQYEGLLEALDLLNQRLIAEAQNPSRSRATVARASAAPCGVAIQGHPHTVAKRSSPAAS
jgi:hypothetical protein